MDKIEVILRNYAAMLLFAVSAIVFLPEMAFGKGAVIGYVWGNTTVTNAQLDYLTHVMVFDLYAQSNGVLFKNPDLPNNWESSRLTPLINAAHQKGVKVSIVIGGGDFISATNNTNRATLVAQIVQFVNAHNLDGVDINWEYPGLDSNWNSKPEPQQSNEWNQCIALLTDLKAALTCKRISMALSATDPTDTWMYPNQTAPTKPIPRQVWEVVDAIHMMTYDMRHHPTHSHSDATDAQNAINEWATWGNSNGLGDPASKEKLHMGCAFYGYRRDAFGNTLWNIPSQADPDVLGNPRVPYHNNGSTCGNPSDTPASVATKVNYCYNNGYGGVFFWELRYDLPANDNQSLLKAIWTANQAKGGYSKITITTHPAANTTVVRRNISGSLIVAASTASCVDSPIYQWYSNATNSNTGGTVIPGATNASFTIPATLTTGTYYYYCIINTIRSNVAKVTVIPSCIIIFSNQTVNSNQTIYGCPTSALTIHNVTVSNGAKLTIFSGGTVNFTDFNLNPGSEYEVINY